MDNRGNYATPVAATDHIEIVKGPPSPIYGVGKIGGFLNFLPKTARSASAKWMERPQAKATVTYGAYDQRIAGAEVGMPFKVNGRRSGLYVNEIRPGLTLRNQTFYDKMDYTKFSAYGFGADYQPWVIENKTSLD